MGRWMGMCVSQVGQRCSPARHITTEQPSAEQLYFGGWSGVIYERRTFSFPSIYPNHRQRDIVLESGLIRLYRVDMIVGGIWTIRSERPA